MTGFPVFTLDPDLLGTVLSKLEGKSYIRLQQTRRDVLKSIQKCHAVSVAVDGHYFLEVKGSSCLFYTSKYYTEKSINLERIYGARLSVLHGPQNGKEFGHMCAPLWKNRITCKKLFMQKTTCTVEQCEALLNILKPVAIFLNSEESNRFEALFQSKTLKSAEVRLKSEDLGLAVPKLLASLRKVEIRALYQSTDGFDLLLTILQILHSKPFPNLRRFHFTVSWEKELFTANDLVEQLEDFQVAKVSNKWKKISAVVDLPPAVSRLSSCKVVVQEYTNSLKGHIYFKQLNNM